MTIRIAVLGLLLIVPGLQAMDLEFKQESVVPTEEREKPITQSIWHAIKEGNKIEVARWLNHDKHLINARLAHIADEDVAALHPHAQMYPRNRYDHFTLLDYCAYHDKPIIAEFLLMHNADVNPPRASILSDGPLISCALHRSVGVAKILLKYKADIHARLGLGNTTALGVAASSGNIDMLELLLAHRAMIEAADRDDDTPLTKAAFYTYINPKYCSYPIPSTCGPLDCIKALLLAGADWRHKNKYGLKAIDLAREFPAGKALLAIPAHGSLPAFLDGMVQAQMPPANRNLRLLKQLELRESGKLKFRKLPQSTADASEGPEQALTALPNTTGIKLIRTLHAQPIFWHHGAKD